jgi:membrane-associated protease RseP (regulator of RpoE activity)
LTVPSDLTSSDWLLVIGVTVAVYTILLTPLKNSEFWKERGITTWGPIPVVFFRTSRGLKLLDYLSRPKLLWRILALAGIPLVILSMTMFFWMLISTTSSVIISPPEPSAYNAPRNLLLIPGLNEFVPFVWGWIALFVTMVVHEFAHGILARVEGIRVKSMGLVFLIAPIAAFVEPDEEELFGSSEKKPLASRPARVRILAAGVISNFVVAAIAMLLFFGPIMAAISPSGTDVVTVIDIDKGSPADLAGFQKNMAVMKVDGREVNGLQDFYSSLQAQSVVSLRNDGQEKNLTMQGRAYRGVMVVAFEEGLAASKAGMPNNVIITALNGTSISGIDDFKSYMNTTAGGEILTVDTNHGTYYLDLGSDKGKGFMGVKIAGAGDAVYADGATFQEFPAKQFLSLIKGIPRLGIDGFYVLLGLPFTGFSGWISNFYQPVGWAEPLGMKFFWIVNTVLWIGWINLYAGLFNCLPAVPLDGGHIFRDLVQSAFERVVSIQMAEKLTGRVVALLAWIILASIIIITVVAPYLAHGLPG